MAEIKSTCRCGATFSAAGNPITVGFRFREWLEIHQTCLEQNEETT